MDVAIIGATGSCGRQVAAQLLECRPCREMAAELGVRRTMVQAQM